MKMRWTAYSYFSHIGNAFHSTKHFGTFEKQANVQKFWFKIPWKSENCSKCYHSFRNSRDSRRKIKWNIFKELSMRHKIIFRKSVNDVPLIIKVCILFLCVIITSTARAGSALLLSYRNTVLTNQRTYFLELFCNLCIIIASFVIILVLFQKISMPLSQKVF